MRPLRIAAAVLVLLGAFSGSAQCVSEIRDITGRLPSLEAGPVAWTGSVLGIAAIQRPTGAIWVTIADERGTALYDRLRLPDTEGSTLYALLTNGAEFSVWFRDRNRNLRMQRVSTTGDFIGEAIYALDDDIFIDDNDRVDVTWSSALNAYVLARSVTTTTPRELWLSVINANGTERSMSRIAADVGPDSFVRVAVTETGIIGVFYEGTSGNVRLVRVEPMVPNVSQNVWTPGGDDLVVAAYQNQFVLARSVSENGRSYILSKIITTGGDEVRSESVLLEGSGVAVRAVSLLARDTELALSYLDAPAGFELQRPRYRLFRFLPTGAPISDVFFAATDPGLRRAATEFDFVWTGSAYVSAAVLELGEADESYLIRYCPLAADIFGPRVVRRGEKVAFTGDASGGVGPYTYEWRYQGGGFVAGPRLELTFTATGQFTFEVTVTDATGAQSAQFFTIQVVEPSTPLPRKRRSVRH